MEVPGRFWETLEGGWGGEVASGHTQVCGLWGVGMDWSWDLRERTELGGIQRHREVQ